MSYTKIVNTFKSEEIFSLKSYAGSQEEIFSAYGNAIVSSVFAFSIDPDTTVEVSYYDTTTGYALGERYEIGSHDILTSKDSGKTKREVFRKFHNKIVCEVKVTGGNALLSVFVTAVTSDRDNDMDSILSMSRSSGFLENEMYDKLLSYEVSNKHRILEYSNDGLCQFQIVAKADGSGFSIEKRDCEFLLLQEDGNFILQETDYVFEEDASRIKVNGLIPV